MGPARGQMQLGLVCSPALPSSALVHLKRPHARMCWHISLPTPHKCSWASLPVGEHAPGEAPSGPGRGREAIQEGNSSILGIRSVV